MAHFRIPLNSNFLAGIKVFHVPEPPIPLNSKFLTESEAVQHRSRGEQRDEGGAGRIQNRGMREGPEEARKNEDEGESIPNPRYVARLSETASEHPAGAEPSNIGVSRSSHRRIG